MTMLDCWVYDDTLGGACGFGAFDYGAPTFFVMRLLADGTPRPVPTAYGAGAGNAYGHRLLSEAGVGIPGFSWSWMQDWVL